MNLTLDEIETAVRASGGHWFDRSMMALYKEKVYNPTLLQRSTGKTLFRSSEVFDGKPRRYTVMGFDPATCTVMAESEPGQFDTKREAMAWMIAASRE